MTHPPIPEACPPGEGVPSLVPRLPGTRRTVRRWQLSAVPHVVGSRWSAPSPRPGRPGLFDMESDAGSDKHHPVLSDTSRTPPS